MTDSRRWLWLVALLGGGWLLYLLTPILPPFLVANGDVFCDLDLRGFLHRALMRLSHPEHLAHLALVDNPAHHPAGDFHLEADAVSADGTPKLTFSGIGVYSPDLFSSLVPGARAAQPAAQNAW